MNLEQTAGRTIERQVGGRLFTFSRVSPAMLIELASHARAKGGTDIRGWLTAEDALKLAQTFEGMRWLAWRAARDHHPEFARVESREAFYSLFDSMESLGEVVLALLDFGAEDKGSDPRTTEDPAT